MRSLVAFGQLTPKLPPPPEQEPFSNLLSKITKPVLLRNPFPGELLFITLDSSEASLTALYVINLWGELSFVDTSIGEVIDETMWALLPAGFDSVLQFEGLSVTEAEEYAVMLCNWAEHNKQILNHRPDCKCSHCTLQIILQ